MEIARLINSISHFIDRYSFVDPITLKVIMKYIEAHVHVSFVIDMGSLATLA